MLENDVGGVIEVTELGMRLIDYSIVVLKRKMIDYWYLLAIIIVLKNGLLVFKKHIHSLRYFIT